MEVDSQMNNYDSSISPNNIDEDAPAAAAAANAQPQNRTQIVHVSLPYYL
jgi:hypothetical protein